MTSTVPYLDEAEIARVADLAELVSAMRASFTAGHAMVVPQRALILRDDPFAAFVAMPAHSDAHALFITKVGAVVPQVGRSVHALIVAMSTRTGRPIATLDGGAITSLKCAGVTAFVTDHCAQPDARVLAILGSGVQAREQLRGVGAVRELAEVRVHSRDPRNVEAFIRRHAGLAPAARFVACASAEAAVDGADVVSTATTSVEPLLAGTALGRPGLHVNCMGAHTPRSRELPWDVLRASTLIVEDVATAVAEAGEVHAGAMTVAALAAANTVQLRSARTVFCSTGHASLDMLATAHVLERLNFRDRSQPSDHAHERQHG